MSFDGIVMRAVTAELHPALAGARIDKIQQPGAKEICLVLRNQQENFRLLLSASAEEAGVYLTAHARTNPAQAPLFCMVLRKHLHGAKVLEVAQQGLDRVLVINCAVIDELGDTAERKLIVEVMGKHSNIILLDAQKNRIIDAIHRVSSAVSRYRQVLPGLDYVPPPPQNKQIPWAVNADAFAETILRQPLTQTISKTLLACFSGMGPQTVEEIILRAGLDPQTPIEYFGEYEMVKLWRAFSRSAEDIKANAYSPQVAVRDGLPLAFSALSLIGFPAGERVSFPTMNEAVDFFYTNKKTSSLFKDKKAALESVVQKEIDRCEKKAGLQLATIVDAEQADLYRLWGELLTANIHALQPGKQAVVANFYETGSPALHIPLDENLTIAENAQRCFQRYQKARHAAAQAQSFYDETRQELTYLYSLASSLENVTTAAELEEIREELQEAGYLKSQPHKEAKPGQKQGQRDKTGGKKPGRLPPAASSPQKIIIDSWEIYIGKNNRQNDLLVTKLARPEDVWLHTKDIPGSHVIIRNPRQLAIPDRILEAAALLAAYHSRARFSVNVPVDYTLKKHVRKPKCAKPGMVRYESQHTVYITPDAGRAKALLEEKTAPDLD